MINDWSVTVIVSYRHPSQVANNDRYVCSALTSELFPPFHVSTDDKDIGAAVLVGDHSHSTP